MNLITPTLPGLMVPSHGYKPFRYPWAHDYWKRQQQIHWMPEEVPLGEDCKDWAGKLTDADMSKLTALFIDAVISLRSFRGYSVDVQIDVKERWYILPLPYFKKVDRNLAQWQDEQFSFDRVKYGFKFNHNNFSGRNDKLRIWLITGYSREIQIQYDQPYADPSLKHGFKVFYPPLEFCTDNGAMIAWAGLERLRLGRTDGLDFRPRPRWPLDPTAAVRV